LTVGRILARSSVSALNGLAFTASIESRLSEESINSCGKGPSRLYSEARADDAKEKPSLRLGRAPG
jgi:hypothetical protein